MFELKVETHFAAAHQLRMVAKKCENLHGHNWRIQVCVTGEKLNNAGVLIDFGILKTEISRIIEKLDHRFLNEVGFFPENYPPSSENIARFIAEQVDAALDAPGVRVSRVTAWESDSACATYIV